MGRFRSLELALFQLCAHNWSLIGRGHTVSGKKWNTVGTQDENQKRGNHLFQPGLPRAQIGSAKVQCFEIASCAQVGEGVFCLWEKCAQSRSNAHSIDGASDLVMVTLQLLIFGTSTRTASFEIFTSFFGETGKGGGA